MPLSAPPAEPTEPETDEAHAAEIAALPMSDAMAAHARWKESPSPQRLADVLRTVQPAIDRTVRRYPRYNAALLGGEARRLAIGAIKSFDPSQGATLSTHVHVHLKGLGREAANFNRAISQSRLERERAAEFLKAQSELYELHGRHPSDPELQDHLKVPAPVLAKMRLAARGEAAESQLDYLPGTKEDDGEDSSRLRRWRDYVYHDLDPAGQQIMDLSMGNNGHPVHDGAQVAAKLGLSPAYVNRRRQAIAEKILAGASPRSETP